MPHSLRVCPLSLLLRIHLFRRVDNTKPVVNADEQSEASVKAATVAADRSVSVRMCYGCCGFSSSS